MKNKILSKATGLFMEFGFKSVTMAFIAYEMGVSKKTIYKHFCNKNLLVKESALAVQSIMQSRVDKILLKNYNAVEENFVIRKTFRKMFKSADSLPVCQLKKYYSEIYNAIVENEFYECQRIFKLNIEKGIRQEFYKKELDIESCKFFYYSLVFDLDKGNVSIEQLDRIELETLEYHIRAMATANGITELEKHLRNFKCN
jgi:AcrR family transcriptional regulator